MPTFNLSADDINALKNHVIEVLQIAYQLSDELSYSLFRAWFRPQTDGNGKQSWNHVKSSINKAGHLSTYKNIEDEYWSQLEPVLSVILDDLIDYGQTTGKPFDIYGKLLKEIQNHCLKYFDQNALNEAIEEMDMKRVIEAKNYLLGALYPNKKGLLKDINKLNSQSALKSVQVAALDFIQI